MTSISTRHLEVKIRERIIFTNINILCPKAKITAITGISGSGKTTLLNTLGLILIPTSGDVYIDSQSTHNWREPERTRFWRDHAAFIYQDYGIIDDENLAYNVALDSSKLGKNHTEICEALRQVGLEKRISDPASVLSGGEKQRLGVARAIYKKADVIFADEPTASLDEKNRQLIFSYLRERANAGATVILSTHDTMLAQSCDQIIEL